MTARCMYGSCKLPLTKKITNERGGTVGYLCSLHAEDTWAASPHPGLHLKELNTGGDTNGKSAIQDSGTREMRGIESGYHSSQDASSTGVEPGGHDSIGGQRGSSENVEGNDRLPVASDSRLSSTPKIPHRLGHSRPQPGAQDPFAVAEALARSGYFSDIRDASQAVVKILAGQELGIGPIASMQGIFIIQGRPAFSANLVATVIQSSDHYRYHVDRLNDEGCALSFYEDGQLLGVSEFSMEDAKRAGLLAGKNAHSWRQYPRNMLFARALTNGARWHCPGAFGGNAAYTPEELGDPIAPNKPGREPDPVLDGEYAKTHDFADDAREHIEGMQ